MTPFTLDEAKLRRILEAMRDFYDASFEELLAKAGDDARRRLQALGFTGDEYEMGLGPFSAETSAGRAQAMVFNVLVPDYDHRSPLAMGPGYHLGSTLAADSDGDITCFSIEVGIKVPPDNALLWLVNYSDDFPDEDIDSLVNWAWDFVRSANGLASDFHHACESIAAVLSR